MSSSISDSEQELIKAVEEFLHAHDQFFAYSGWNIVYYSDRDKAAHIEEQKAVAVLREVLAKKQIDEKLVPETPFTQDELKALQNSPFKGPSTPWPEKQVCLACNGRGEIIGPAGGVFSKVPCPECVGRQECTCPELKLHQGESEVCPVCARR